MDQHSENLPRSAHHRAVSLSTPMQCEQEASSPCRRNQKKRRRPHRRRRPSKSASRQFLFALCSIFFISTACLMKQSQAFSSSSSIYQSRISKAPSGFLAKGPAQRGHRANNASFYMSAVIEPTSQSSNTRLSDFQRRMKGIVKRNGVANGRKVVGTSSSAPERPKNLKEVHTLEEYKDQLDESSGKIVVVRFFATWCKVRTRD